MNRKGNKIEGLGAFVIGHKYGIDPNGTVRQMIKENWKEKVGDLISGFDQGRADYIKYNGPLEDPVPQVILSMFLLGQFYFDGYLNIKLEKQIYTAHQLNFIRPNYEKGIKEHPQDWTITLGSELEKYNIKLL